MRELPISNTRLALKNILDFLTYLDIMIKEKDSTLLQIPSSVFIHYFSDRKYKQYVDILKELEVISDVPYNDGSFYNKEKGICKQYRVFNNYMNEDDLCIVVLKEDRAKFEFINEIEDLDKRAIDTLKNTEVNVKEAIAAEIQHCYDNELSTYTLRNRISRILYTKRKRYIKKGKSVDRIYHSFTNLSKVARKHLNVKFYDIDIKNCQPLLLVAFLSKNELSFDQDYKNDCESGLFYERFVGINDWDRDQVKTQLYKSIFFGFNRRSKINKRFKELYPSTWSSLDTQVNGTLASKLQNLEAELFNNLTPIKSKKYFTLFDAIYFDNINDISKLNTEILNFFNKYDIKVSTEVGY